MMYSQHLSRYLESQHHPAAAAASLSSVIADHSQGSHASGLSVGSTIPITPISRGSLLDSVLRGSPQRGPQSSSLTGGSLLSARGRKKGAPLDPSKAVHCSECLKQFSHDFHLKIHMRSHTGERPYECSVCMKRFTQKGNLDTHMRKHTGDRPFKCEVCSKAFTQKGNMETHMRLHTGEKPFQCMYCTKRFYQQGGLRNHKCCNDPGTADGADRKERRGRKPTYANDPVEQEKDPLSSPPLIPKKEPNSHHMYLSGHPVFSDMFIKQEQIQHQNHQQQNDNNNVLDSPPHHTSRQQFSPSPPLQQQFSPTPPHQQQQPLHLSQHNNNP